MPKVAVVTDSIACLPPEAVQEYGVHVVPLNIYFDGRVYREGVDITAPQAYELLAAAPDRFTTSPSSAGECFEVFRKVSTWSSAILCVTISSKLSTIYEMARMASEQAREELPGITIEVLDSLNAGAGETLIALAAARAAAEVKEPAEVLAVAEAVRDKVVAIGLFDTIRHIYRTGRVPKFAARMVSSLSIRPLFNISGGAIHITGVDRSKERGVRRLLNIMKKRVTASPSHVAVSHANVPEEGERLRQRIADEFNCVETLLTDFSPIMGYATGEGALEIAFYSDD